MLAADDTLGMQQSPGLDGARRTAMFCMDALDVVAQRQIDSAMQTGQPFRGRIIAAGTDLQYPAHCGEPKLGFVRSNESVLVR